MPLTWESKSWIWQSRERCYALRTEVRRYVMVSSTLALSLTRCFDTQSTSQELLREVASVCMFENGNDESNSQTFSFNPFSTVL